MVSIYLDAFTPEISGDKDSVGEFYFVTRSGMNSHRWPTEKEEVDVEFLVAEKDWGQDDLFLQIIKRIDVAVGLTDFELTHEGYCSMKVRVAIAEAGQ